MTANTGHAQRGAFVLSIDFELHWGMYNRLAIADCGERLLAARRVVPILLETFMAFDVRATWAIVGMLLVENKRELLDALPQRRPAYAKRNLSAYDLLDQIGEDERDDPFHFAPSLARQIATTPGQEIGTHTFAHYYCREGGQSAGDFRADLEVAIAVTQAKLGVHPRSLVFPRNQVVESYLEVCRDLGIIAYRGNPDAWAYRARSGDEECTLHRAARVADAYLPLTGRRSTPLGPGMVPINVPASQYLRPYRFALRPFEALRMRRIMNGMHDAARRGRIFHLWWHPDDFAAHTQENLDFLRQILTCFTRLRDEYGIESLTMAEVAERALTGDPV